MTLRLLAAAAALAFLPLAASAGAFIKLSLPADWPAEEPKAPACAADRQLATLEASLQQTSFRVARFAGADAADYLAGVKALYDADLPPADLLVIVEVMPQGTSDPSDAIEIVFGFKDGCLVFRVEAHAEAHQKVLDWVKRNKAGESVRVRRDDGAARTAGVL